jgi:flagellar protein FliO/FliZ
MRKPNDRTPVSALLLTCAAAVLQAGSAAVLAAESATFAAPQATALPSTGAGSLLQVTIALSVVLAAVFAAAWLMQRLRTLGGGRSGSIKVIASVALGAKERAVLVQLGSQQLLLGVAPGRVSTLHVLAEPLDNQQPGGPASVQGMQSQAPDFKAQLRKSLGLS